MIFTLKGEELRWKNRVFMFIFLIFKHNKNMFYSVKADLVNIYLLCVYDIEIEHIEMFWWMQLMHRSALDSPLENGHIDANSVVVP